MIAAGRRSEAGRGSYQGVISLEPRCWASQSSLTFPTFRSVCRRRNNRRTTIANSPTEPVHNTILRACAFTWRRCRKSRAAREPSSFYDF